MSFDWWTFVLQTINFAILVWLLHRFLYKPVLRQIDKRRDEINSDYAKAEQARLDGEARLAEIEQERAGIAMERTAALKTAAAEAAEAAASRKAQAERDAKQLLEEGRKSLAAERQEALSSLRQTALDFGADIALRLLEDIPADYRTEVWLDRILAYMAGLDARQRAAIISGLRDGEPLRVVTANALSQKAIEAWQEGLRAALGGTVEIAFDVDPELIAGAEIHTPDAVIRLSWRSELAAIRAELEKGHGDTR